MQIQMKAKTAKAVAKKFKNKYKSQDIYNITKEYNGKDENGYRITAVSKGTFPKSKLSNYN